MERLPSNGATRERRGPPEGTPRPTGPWAGPLPRDDPVPRPHQALAAAGKRRGLRDSRPALPQKAAGAAPRRAEGPIAKHDAPKIRRGLICLRRGEGLSSWKRAAQRVMNKSVPLVQAVHFCHRQPPRMVPLCLLQPHKDTGLRCHHQQDSRQCHREAGNAPVQPEHSPCYPSRGILP